MIARVGRAAALWLLVAACERLPAVPAGQCGNAVVEPDEDCDSFAPPGVPGGSCRPPGGPGQCRIDCGRSPAGRRPCPAGWGCDAQELCRAPTGEFTEVAPARVAGAWTLLAGDFDGDGRSDVLGREPLDALGRTGLRLHYFDDGGLPTASIAFPKQVSSPTLTDVSGDGRADLIFGPLTAGVLLGQADRSWVPESFDSYNLPDTSIRVVAAREDAFQDFSAVVALATVEGKPTLLIPQRAGLLRRGTLPGPIEALAGDPVSGDLVESATSPCWEIVVAARAATTLVVFDVCTRDAAGAVVWRTAAQELTVALEPPAPIDGAPQVVDIDGDEHLDVLVGAGGRAYVAYGDGTRLAPARPMRVMLVDLLSGTEMELDLPAPLAAGDFTGDGRADFVTGTRFIASLPATAAPLPRYRAPTVNGGAPWTSARVADLNRDGRLDVVAASSRSVGVDFFNGTGGMHLIPSRLSSNGPVRHLATGDFDGDLVADLAFLETTAASERDGLLVAFGNLSGPPSAPVTVARIAQTEQLAVLHELGRSVLLVASARTVAGRKRGQLAVLEGLGDRLPFAPRQLVTLGPDGSLEGASALALTAGSFRGAVQPEVLALSTVSHPADRDWVFWLLPALASLDDVAMPLRGKIDPRLLPASGTGDEVVIHAAGVPADLNRDRRDEAVWAMAADELQRCGLLVAGTAPGTNQLTTSTALVVDHPCVRPQVIPVDADADGFLDVALLADGRGASGARLMVLWNDGKGGLAPDRATPINPPGDSPREFTVLRPVPARPLTFAYVTDRAVQLVTSAGGRRFAAPITLTSLPGATGIVAADVDGDEVEDLALAASGKLSIWRAKVKAP